MRGKREILINVALVVWVFVIEPSIVAVRWLVSSCLRFVKKYPRFSLCFTALCFGIFALRRAYTSNPFDATPAATAWSCIGAALIIGVVIYGLYRVATTGPHPLQGTRLVEDRK